MIEIYSQGIGQAFLTIDDPHVRMKVADLLEAVVTNYHLRRG